MNLREVLPPILDVTYPHESGASLAWIWSAGIILGEALAWLIVSVGIRYLSKKKVSWLDSFLVGALATGMSFTFGVIWWLTIGFW